MEKIKVSCVSYLNSRPFLFGLQNTAISNEIELSLDVPSKCADKLIDGVVDIGLVPVAVLDELNEFHVISDYCIGAEGEVGSVLLLSDVPLNKIKTVLLDYNSRTSALLVQVLADKFWNINPGWVDTDKNYEQAIAGDTAGLVIGDRTFELKKKYNYAFDLSAEWKQYTNLPFVFACWTSNRVLDRGFVKRFNDALRYGLMNTEQVIEEYIEETGAHIDVRDYLENKISYGLDKRKKFSLELFINYMHELQEEEMMKIV
jgi:chorismate dehydratase